MPSSTRDSKAACSKAELGAVFGRAVTGRAAAVLGLVLLQAACVPLDDLSSYSSAWRTAPDVSNAEEMLDASSDTIEGGDADADSTDLRLDASRPLRPEPDGDSGEPSLDAGDLPATDPVNSESGVASSLDAGTLDAAIAFRTARAPFAQKRPE